MGCERGLYVRMAFRGGVVRISKETGVERQCGRGSSSVSTEQVSLLHRTVVSPYLSPRLNYTQMSKST
jgi:hypothetical protein